MGKINYKTSYGLGTSNTTKAVFSNNHFAGLGAYSPEVRTQISDWGLTRVAGNTFICESSKDFWAVKGGKIIKLVSSDVVNNHESIPPAPEERPGAFIAGLLGDLSFD